MFHLYFFRDYMWQLLTILAVAILSGIASARVHRVFKKYDGVPCRSGISGHEAAVSLLRSEGAGDIRVEKVAGELSDHYHPKNAVVNLSESTYSSKSVSAVAVAAHEIGHVMQNKSGYFLYNVRTALVPAVNIGSRLAFPLVLIGLLLDAFVTLSDPDTGMKPSVSSCIHSGTGWISM